MCIKIIFCLQYYEQYDTLDKKWPVSNVKNNQFIQYDSVFPACSLDQCLINSANESSNAKETITPTSQIQK